MGCCFSRLSKAASRDEQDGPLTPPQQIVIPEAANDNPTTAAEGAAVPIPIAATQGTIDATTPTEVLSLMSPASPPPLLGQPASNEHVILEPRVYVPPAARAEFEAGPADAAPKLTVNVNVGDNDKGKANDSTTTSSSSSSSGAKKN